MAFDTDWGEVTPDVIVPLLFGVIGNTKRLQEQDWGHHSKNEVSASVPGRKRSLLRWVTERGVQGAGQRSGTRGQVKMPHFCKKMPHFCKKKPNTQPAERAAGAGVRRGAGVALAGQGFRQGFRQGLRQMSPGCVVFCILDMGLASCSED